ncbi:molybdenum cofactor synthesis domain [Methanococcus aeolicus Nankai-3]|uniref:Molybdenum cofactor synthesis domain n=1 Tax=Methanococcus aeolicus (strain ATCC BAA-1280 / DSM 17508 / OCM 812 / Nankai-3) TaxID=419665 RepID=A6UW29_META3|nr:molybdopterin biosynthesis protein [Methanococcus aeolicus]ABR56701.1 molybdenum cofactor synthesis domain [Methanococcus aeolicus Nankai-3]
MRYLELSSIEEAKKIINKFLNELQDDKYNKDNKNINNDTNNTNTTDKDSNDKNNGIEEVDLFNAVNRILAEDIISNVDVPPFDRSKMDGYAVKSEDTYEAEEDAPITLKIIDRIKAGSYSTKELKNNECMEIATGAPIPKGANAVVMVEYTETDNNNVKIYRPVSPHENIQYCGSDIMAGELLLRKDTPLSPRDIGALPSIGKSNIKVYKKPPHHHIKQELKSKINIGLISTGNELISPNEPLSPYKIYDVNTYTIASSIIEKGWDFKFYGIVKDNEEDLKNSIKKALQGNNDIIILSGGTSAGVGDLTSKIIEELGGEILIHGIKIKPGKPTIIGKIDNKLIVGLPGYPTSCLTIFDVLFNEMGNKLTGLFPIRYMSSKGRTEYLPVSVMREKDNNYIIYPITKGSGAITSLTYADGYIVIDENKEILENETVEVHLFGNIKFGLNIIGSHCIGIDEILRKGHIFAKTINVGSLGGLMAIKRGEADISGIHLLDERAKEGEEPYNISFIKKYKLKDVALVRGYVRKQGFMFRKELPINNIEELKNNIENYKFINRNKGAGTRLLFDKFLKENNINKSKINGYNIEAKTHSAVGASVVMGKVDIGVGIETIAEKYGLKFMPIGDEYYDFLIKKDKLKDKEVQKFIETLKTIELPFRKSENTGKIIYEC